MKHWLYLILILSPLMRPVWVVSAEPTVCMQKVLPLQNQSEIVAELDGVWGLFQKTPELQNSSVQGITLDNKINSILFHLEYLCSTIHGIPFDELSDYVSSNLADKGPKKFKDELLNLGKSEGEIEVWFKFSEFAVANLNRKLNPQIVFATIKSSQPYINEYLQLAEKIKRKAGLDSVIPEAQRLTDKIEIFFKSDPYMAQAIHENAQVPYADFDENYGGS